MIGYHLEGHRAGAGVGLRASGVGVVGLGRLVVDGLLVSADIAALIGLLENNVGLQGLALEGPAIGGVLALVGDVNNVAGILVELVDVGIAVSVNADGDVLRELRGADEVIVVDVVILGLINVISHIAEVLEVGAAAALKHHANVIVAELRSTQIRSITVGGMTQGEHRAVAGSRETFIYPGNQ